MQTDDSQRSPSARVEGEDGAIFALERPAPKLMGYYVLCCLLAGPFFPFVVIPYFFRYHTLRYRFDAEGVSMRWGILFRREIILSYARIQDIHLCSNLVERWLGLARIQIQTASGSASAEMTLEGLLEFNAVRDFLYRKMRGHQGERTAIRRAPSSRSPGSETADPDRELAEILRQVASEVRNTRLALEAKRPEPPATPHA